MYTKQTMILLLNVTYQDSTKKDIRLDLENDTLRITAEKKVSDESKKRTIFRQERYYGRIERTVRLPDYVDKNKIQAKYEDGGVLKITVPKKESARGETKKDSYRIIILAKEQAIACSFSFFWYYPSLIQFIHT